MIIMELFMALRLGLHRKWAVLACLFLIMLNAPDATTGDLNGKVNTDHIKRHERRLGPFKIGERQFSVILTLTNYQGAPEGFDETVEACSIVDEKGKVHYQKSFDVEYGKDGFIECLSVWAYALESCDRKFFRQESGRLKEEVSQGCVSKGLILYFGVTPSAPLSGVSCQIFASQGERLIPLSSPLTVYGQIYELPHGTDQNAARLFADDTMKFGVWTGWFEVVVPVKVLEKLRLMPVYYDLTFDCNAFNVIVERRPEEAETFVRFFTHPDASSIPRHVIIRKDTKVEFLLAHAKVSIESGGAECAITIYGMPWLKVRIDGEEGFIRDAEDLMALGIHQAG